MHASSRRSALTLPLPFFLALLLMACQSGPSQLYVLSALATPGHTAASPPLLVDAAAHGHSGPVAAGKRIGTVGVAATVPEYLDRLAIVERTGANELKPNDQAQWGEDLATDATRVVAEDLAILLPTADVVMLPSRVHRPVDYEINLNFVRFEGDAAGNSVAAGEWTISASNGQAVANCRFQRKEPLAETGFDALAAAMSWNLAAVSADLAGALNQLSPAPRAER